MPDLQFYRDALKKAIIEIKNNPLYLKDLLAQANNDSDLGLDEKALVLIEITQKNEQLIGSASTQNEDQDQDTDTGKRPEREFPRYYFLDDALNQELDCGLETFNRRQYESYPHWLLEEYLPRFHPLIKPELQNPVLVTFMLMNSMAGNRNTKFPMLWIQGLAGIGKSELGKAFTMHYPESCHVEVRPSWTGASIRDALDARFGDGTPGIMLADNIWVREFLDRVGVFRDQILANCRKDATSAISSTSSSAESRGKSTYHTHCLKVFTSVDDGKEGASSAFSEIARRLWVIPLQDTGAKPLSRDLFSWSACQEEYKRFWGHEAKDRITTEYAKIFARVARTKADKIHFPMKIWEMLLVPLATYEYVGLGTVEEGMKIFQDHRDWVYSTDTANVDSVLQAIKGFFEKRNEDIEEMLRKDATSPFVKKEGWLEKRRNEYENIIDPGHLKQFIERALETKVNTQMFDKTIQIMAERKYLYRVKDGKGIFVKQ